MVTDPYDVLGLPADADDEAIRRKYLELVRQFTPDQNPEKFAQVRSAYEALKDLNTRLGTACRPRSPRNHRRSDRRYVRSRRRVPWRRCCGQAALTPAEIEAALSEFRLAGATRRASPNRWTCRAPVDCTPWSPSSPQCQEVNLQTRAVRTQQEQSARCASGTAMR